MTSAARSSLGAVAVAAFVSVAAGGSPVDDAAGRQRSVREAAASVSPRAIRLVPAASSSGRHSYGWPVRPFLRQHPVRGGFGDPRIIWGRSYAFHFGVDVACANGTSVYAVADGRARVTRSHPTTVSVVTADRAFGYRHVEPLVRNGQRVFAYRTVVGVVLAPWRHVHFSERSRGRYVNPLRPGGMGPFVDRTVPRIRALTAQPGAAVRGAVTVRGRVDLAVVAWESAPLRAAQASRPGEPVSPTVIRWRLRRARTPAWPWRTSTDFRSVTPRKDLWSMTYTPGTRQNRRWHRGYYELYLARGFDTTLLADGGYALDVQAIDVRGNAALATFAVIVSNRL